MDNYSQFVYEIKDVLPKKIINFIADEVESAFNIERKENDESNGRYTRTFTVKEVSNATVTVVCNLVWEYEREDCFTPKGFFLSLTGSCTDGKTTVNDDKVETIDGYKCSHSIHDLVHLLEDYFLEEWAIEEINNFIADIKAEFKKKESESLLNF